MYPTRYFARKTDTTRQETRKPQQQSNRRGEIRPGPKTLVAHAAKLLFSYIQTQYQFGNWADLPKSVDRNICNVFNNINIPKPGLLFTGERARLLNRTKQEIQTMVRDHLTAVSHDIMSQLALLEVPQGEIEAVKVVARRFLRKHYGNRIGERRIFTWLGEGIELLGSLVDRTNVEASLKPQTITANKTTESRLNFYNSQSGTCNSKGKAPIGKPWVIKGGKGNHSKGLTKPAEPEGVVVHNYYDVLTHTEETEAEVEEVNINPRTNTGTPPPPVIKNRTEPRSPQPRPFSEVVKRPRTGIINNKHNDNNTINNKYNTINNINITNNVPSKMLTPQKRTYQQMREEQPSTSRRDTGEDRPTPPSTTPPSKRVNENRTPPQITGSENNAGNIVNNNNDITNIINRNITPINTNTNVNRTQPPAQGGSMDQLNTGRSSPGNKNTTEPGVRKHDGKNKAQWWYDIKRNTTTLIIADSNFRYAKDIPRGWQVEVFSGAKLAQANNLLSKLRSLAPPKSLERVIVSVGVNNRGWTRGSIQKDLNRLIATMMRAPVPCYFLGISIPSGFEAEPRRMCEYINEHAKRRLTWDEVCLYLQPLPREDIQCEDDGLHYTPLTVLKIFISLYECGFC